ncbi:SHOCT domain-containing protein [Paraburkholderia strydomiana]|uniref:SHOCT domain-containing protein n=1 Tax=Paraburkholderia strydomiana TaxID=1245417 RepID=A0ABW9EGB2_9BURK
MKRITIAAVAMVLAGCVSAPDLDLSKVDPACSQRCSSEYSTCTTGFKLFPLVAQAHCNESLKVCAATCPASQPVITATPPAQKLAELNNLYKQGLITEKEYDAKKQEILKAL